MRHENTNDLNCIMIDLSLLHYDSTIPVQNEDVDQIYLRSPKVKGESNR